MNPANHLKMQVLVECAFAVLVSWPFHEEQHRKSPVGSEVYYTKEEEQLQVPEICTGLRFVREHIGTIILTLVQVFMVSRNATNRSLVQNWKLLPEMLGNLLL